MVIMRGRTHGLRGKSPFLRESDTKGKVPGLGPGLAGNKGVET